MDFTNKLPRIKNCPMCRLAMVAEGADNKSAEFNRFRCLGCDFTITITPTRTRKENTSAVGR